MIACAICVMCSRENVAPAPAPVFWHCSHCGALLACAKRWLVPAEGDAPFQVAPEVRQREVSA